MNKISENKINEIIKDLNKYKTLDNEKHKAGYYYQAYQNVISSDYSDELKAKFIDAYSKCKKHKAKEKVETDDRAITNVERDENGLIQYYTFEIYRRESPTLNGKLDRREMETIYRLYSLYGANLTQKIVSREFPQFTFIEFKRILRAFNIYKANSEFAPHIIEERSEEELINLHNQNKENNVLRRVEKDQLSEANRLINKLAQENQRLSKVGSLFEHLLTYDSKFKNEKPNLEIPDNLSETLIIWLSDLHIGAYNEKFGFYQLPNYDKKEIVRRLDKIISTFAGFHYENIVIADLGDSIDQYNKETTRGGHLLPNNMTDKEMSHLYLDCMEYFFKNIKDLIKATNYVYFSVGESNHSGNFGWALNLALSYKLQQKGWKTYVSDYPIDDFTIDNMKFICTHGKDNQNQSKQFPLTLNPQTELYFANYIAEKKLNQNNEKIYVIKGDLHQYAYTSGKQFDYISVGSMYATSNYIAANWGNTPWSINYSHIIGNNIMFGKIGD
jgi:hypothetical protein